MRDSISLAVAAALIGNGWVSHGVLAKTNSSLNFEEPERDIAPDHAVAPGYRADVLIRWGDPIAAHGKSFNAANLDARDQQGQFGYNNDFIAFMPLPKGSSNAEKGLLCVNHEYTDADLMWSSSDLNDTSKKPEILSYEMAAHGHSVLEIEKVDGRWQVNLDSFFARRLNATTPMLLSGPAVGHARLRTTADPTGRTVVGTINNCAGGKTPWGTVLIAEENFDDYFGGFPEGTPQEQHYKRYGIEGSPRYDWYVLDKRFDILREPNESNRFGWVVELDPYDPASTPIKRTALGRFKHESASVWIDKSGKVVVYSGDDEAFQFLYRYVSSKKFDKKSLDNNSSLLDEGVLFVARFEEDGTLQWLPIVHGENGLTPRNGFKDQGEVLIETRKAAEICGATALDRPEDIAIDPSSGNVYVALTNNKHRTVEQIDAVSPRAPNLYGGIIELIPHNGDHAAERFRWHFFAQGGDPKNSEHGAKYHSDTSDRGWWAAPDNLAVDPFGRLWIATDQDSEQATIGIPDGLYACDIRGPGRALSKFFYRCPDGAEMCGPEFTPDGRTLFVSVQHPGDGVGASFDSPTTRWPDFKSDIPPRPSVVVITKKDRGRIGD